MKNKLTAWLLAILWWTLGFHKFYLGKWVQGIIYLLLCATGIPTILWILEWIIYLGNTKEHFDINYNFEYIKRQKELWYKEKTLWEKYHLSTSEDVKNFIVWLVAIFIWIIIYLVSTY